MYVIWTQSRSINQHFRTRLGTQADLRRTLVRAVDISRHHSFILNHRDIYYIVELLVNRLFSRIHEQSDHARPVTTAFHVSRGGHHSSCKASTSMSFHNEDVADESKVVGDWCDDQRRDHLAVQFSREEAAAVHFQTDFEFEGNSVVVADPLDDARSFCLAHSPDHETVIPATAHFCTRRESNLSHAATALLQQLQAQTIAYVTAYILVRLTTCVFFLEIQRWTKTVGGFNTRTCFLLEIVDCFCRVCFITFIGFLLFLCISSFYAFLFFNVYSLYDLI